MASEKIDELLVGLGLDADKASFDQGIGMFNNVRTAALSLAGVLATSFGAKTVMNFAQQADQAGRMADNLNVSTGYLRQMGFAFSQVGSSSADAISDIQTMRRIMDDVQTNPGGDSFALMAAMGLDPEGIALAENVMDAYALLIERGSKLSADQRRIAFQDLGLSQGSISLADEGPEFMRQQMEFSKQTAELTNEMVQQSREFNQELNKLNSTAAGIKDAISIDLIGKLGPLLETINSLMEGVSPEEAANVWNYGPWGLLKNWLDDDDDNGGGGSPPQASSGNMSRTDIRRMVAEAEKDIGAPRGLLWAQLGVESSYNPNAVSKAGARGLAQIMPDTERSLEQRFGRDLDPFNPVDAIAMQKELMRENYEASGDWNTALRMYHGGWDRSAWGPVNEDYAPSVRDRMRQTTQPERTRDVTFNIYDATDPNKVAQVVDGRLKEMSERAAEDFRTGIA